MPSIVFKEWLPDHPDLGNGGLITATNVIPSTDGAYVPYAPLTAGAAATVTSVNSAFPYATTAGSTAGPWQIYGLIAGTPSDLFAFDQNTFNSKRSATYGGSASSGSSQNFWRFAQFDNIILATNKIDSPQQWTIGASSFTALSSSSGSAPTAQQVAIVNRFAVLGNLATPSQTGFHTVQWSGIDDIDSWPTPNSATAIAQQSGRQVMDSSAGTVTGITNADQVSVVFQRAAVTRMTYVGPPVVFQFDKIDPGRGCFYPNSIVQVGHITYYASGLGFFMTDGVSVSPIGDAKVDKFFADLVSGQHPSTAVYGAVDYESKCVIWSVNGQKLLHYNYVAQRWSVANENARVLVNGIQRS